MIKERHRASDLHIENMHAQDFPEPKGNTIWTKHQVNQDGTPKSDTP